MSPYLHLLIHNIICIISAIAAFGMAVFTYLNGPRKTANLAWCGMIVTAEIFILSHVIGANISDPILSRNVFMFNLATLFIGAFNVHAVYALVGKARESRLVIYMLYLGAIVISIFFILSPDLYFLPSVPKMYFPNYYNPGIFNTVRIIYVYIVCWPFMLHILYKAHKDSIGSTQSRSYMYLMYTMIAAYVLAFVPNFLVYNIPIDPLWGMSFASVFMVLFLYGSIKYGLFDVKVIAKQAFFYSIGVAGVGGIIIILNYLNNALQRTYPGFPIWITPLVSATIAMTLGVFIWKQLRQNAILKYEFVTTATHKFRTPLTHIKWAAENLLEGDLKPEDREQVEYIQTANSKLVELTTLLMNVSETENVAYEYHKTTQELGAIINETITTVTNQLSIKKVTIIRAIQKDLYASFDISRIRFIVQTFIENAIHYTPENATITVSAFKRGNEITLSVKDTGIGIAKNELPFLFSKFYRGASARLADTEGMGIGLYMSREIIAKHQGKIWAESEGENKGSTFSFSIPAGK